MNLVIDDAVEVHLKKDSRRALGRILLKGENVTLISQTEV
jgi:small nuclear ribonucleoprotein E